MIMVLELQQVSEESQLSNDSLDAASSDGRLI